MELVVGLELVMALDMGSGGGWQSPGQRYSVFKHIIWV